MGVKRKQALVSKCRAKSPSPARKRVNEHREGSDAVVKRGEKKRPGQREELVAVVTGTVGMETAGATSSMTEEHGRSTINSAGETT